MNRKNFIKTFAALTGGITLVNCSSDLVTDIIAGDEPLENISIKEAQKWFESNYLPQMKGSLRTNGKRAHKRKAAWESAQKPKNLAKKEYVWVPIDYEDEARPGIVCYDDETLFKKELYQYYLQPVIEGLIVVKIKGQTSAFLAQIAIDMPYIVNNKYVINKSNFTGTLLKSGWDDEVITGIVYENGIPIKGFKNTKNESDYDIENGRVQGCVYTMVNAANTWYVDSNNELVIVVHNIWSVTCDGSGNGGFMGFDGTGGGNGSGGTTPGGNSGDGSYYDPLVHSGSGNITYPDQQIYQFNLTQALAGPGPHRNGMSTNLKNGVIATGLAASLAGWSLDKATALAKTIGGNITHFTPGVVRFGTNIGAAAIAVSGVQLAVGIMDNGWQLSEEGPNSAAFILGTAGFVAGTVFAAPWIAVGLGGLSLIISVATVPTHP